MGTSVIRFKTGLIIINDNVNDLKIQKKKRKFIHLFF